ncbi:HNH endonuclease family protein [Aeromonas caviae]|uniref:hypothetical protein n=1 Tax=Aeromonas caviae TaxID=648 RepID=UPI0022550503|nr:hypothetical protein [Aeromonas caviae]MCX4071682.1 hypothetical protein [Aeromonas caviae]
MTLGPPKLTGSGIRFIVNKKNNKKIISEFQSGNIDWSDRKLSTIKSSIRKLLRQEQGGRCVYCRRIIIKERNNVYEDIEHYLDKSKKKYRQWAFLSLNLSLACHACNFQKSTKDLGHTHNITPYSSYPKGIGFYHWLHPHFDNFHDNIEIRKGWVYVVKNNAPSPIQAQNQISECKLDSICSIEAHSEIIKDKILRLTSLSLRAMKRNKHSLAAALINASLQYQKDIRFDY